jgi:hypothetical protein
MKLAISLLFSSVLGFAAAWDGTKGDITIATVEQTVRVGEFEQPYMMVAVKCSNPAVSAVRVTITIHSGSFTSTRSQLVEIGVRHSGVATFPNTVAASVTVPPIVTMLYDGAVSQF